MSKIRLNQRSNIKFVDKFKNETRKALADQERLSKDRILSAMKRDEIKEQDNTSHEASSTVRTEPLRVSASETNKEKRNRRRGV